MSIYRWWSQWARRSRQHRHARRSGAASWLWCGRRRRAVAALTSGWSSRCIVRRSSTSLSSIRTRWSASRSASSTSSTAAYSCSGTTHWWCRSCSSPATVGSWLSVRTLHSRPRPGWTVCRARRASRRRRRSGRPWTIWRTCRCPFCWKKATKSDERWPVSPCSLFFHRRLGAKTYTLSALLFVVVRIIRPPKSMPKKVVNFL